MTWWGVYALVILALPVMLVIHWLVADWLKARRQAKAGTGQADDPRHVSTIVARVKQERADEHAAGTPTEVLPVIPPDDEPTQGLQTVELLKRNPRPVPRRPTPYPRKTSPRPEQTLMERVLTGLRRIPEQPRYCPRSRAANQAPKYPARRHGAEVVDTQEKKDH